MYRHLTVALWVLFSIEVTRTTVVLRDVIMCHMSTATVIQQNVSHVDSCCHTTECVTCRQLLSYNRMCHISTAAVIQQNVSHIDSCCNTTECVTCRQLLSYNRICWKFPRLPALSREPFLLWKATYIRHSIVAIRWPDKAELRSSVFLIVPFDKSCHLHIHNCNKNPTCFQT